MSSPRATMEAIREAVLADRWSLTRHARERAELRDIGPDALAHALEGGDLLEDYPEDPRGASALVLGHTKDGRPLHAVCALDPSGEMLVITVYEPRPPRWRDERARAGGREED